MIQGVQYILSQEPLFLENMDFLNTLYNVVLGSFLLKWVSHEYKVAIFLHAL